MVAQVVLLILLELENSGRPAWTVGAVLAAAGVGGIIGAAAAGRLTARFPASLVYRVSLWAWTVPLVPIALSDDPFVPALCWGGVGAVGVAGNVAMTVYRVAVIPEHILGRAMATIALVNNGAVALGAGYLLSALGTGPVRWITLAAMFGLACSAGIRPIRSFKTPGGVARSGAEEPVDDGCR